MDSSESALNRLRDAVAESIHETGYNIELPSGDWMQLRYRVGPIEGRLTLHEKLLCFEFFLGKYSNKVSGSVLATNMAQAIPAPGPSVRSSLSPQPILELSIEVPLGLDNAFTIARIAIAQTADLAINLLKVGISTGQLLDPTSSQIGEFGLCKPTLFGRQAYQSRNWNNTFAGSEFLLVRGHR